MDVVEEDAARKGRQSSSVGVVQILDEQGELLFELFGKELDELSPFRGEGDVHGTPILRCGETLNEAATFGPRHQPGDARLVEIQVRRERVHRGLSIAQDAQKPHLGERQLVRFGDPLDRRVHRERKLHQAVQQAQVAPSA